MKICIVSYNTLHDSVIEASHTMKILLLAEYSKTWSINKPLNILFATYTPTCDTKILHSFHILFNCSILFLK
jgi:hypothetical protein